MLQATCFLGVLSGTSSRELSFDLVLCLCWVGVWVLAPSPLVCVNLAMGADLMCFLKKVRVRCMQGIASRSQMTGVIIPWGVV